jgi:hypothetical protein
MKAESTGGRGTASYELALVMQSRMSAVNTIHQ